MSSTEKTQDRKHWIPEKDFYFKLLDWRHKGIRIAVLFDAKSSFGVHSVFISDELAETSDMTFLEDHFGQLCDKAPTFVFSDYFNVSQFPGDK